MAGGNLLSLTINMVALLNNVKLDDTDRKSSRPKQINQSKNAARKRSSLPEVRHTLKSKALLEKRGQRVQEANVVDLAVPAWAMHTNTPVATYEARHSFGLRRETMKRSGTSQVEMSPLGVKGRASTQYEVLPSVETRKARIPAQPQKKAATSRLPSVGKREVVKKPPWR